MPAFLRIILVALPYCVIVALSLNPAMVHSQDLAAQEATAIKAAIARIAPAVVRIETVGGQERVGQFRTTTATNGLIIHEEGYVLSSTFGFAQAPSAILVRMPDGNTQAARIVARNHSRKLVLLKVDAGSSPLPIPDFADRKDLVVGQWSIAVGRSFALDQPNVSVGILSATHRIWDRAVQTDAKISPANYGGPLVNIQGEVIGLLVPLSPEEQSELAGTEWYDSGIGFAVPLSDTLEHFEQLKEGKDLHAGLLGVTLKGRNIYADPAIIATCPSNTPAGKAGLKVGDEIVEISGHSVARQAQLKHALGPLYAGDMTHVVARRGEERLEFDIELVATIEAFQHAFLGVLPERAGEPAAGVTVRFVFPGSPASTAGLKAGDKLLAIQGLSLTSLDAWLEALALHQPGDEVTIKYERDGAESNVQAILATLPEQVPQDDIPPAIPTNDDTLKTNLELITLKVPEQSNECLALLPPTATGQTPAGLVIWLPNPKKFDETEFRARWEPLVAKYGWIVLAPQPEDPQRWQPTEIEFIRKIVDQVASQYAIDSTRVVTFGQLAGGSLAYRFAMENRDLVRAIVTVDAALPTGLQLRANDPVDRLAFLVAFGEASSLASTITKDVAKLREMKFPVTVINWTGDSRALEESELGQVARWIDTLDRL